MLGHGCTVAVVAMRLSGNQKSQQGRRSLAMQNGGDAIAIKSAGTLVDALPLKQLKRLRD